MKKLALIVIACFSVGGCVSQQQQLEQQQALSDQQCQSYGAKPGSDAYVACRTQLAAMQQNQASQRRSAALLAAAQGMQNASQGYYRAAASRPQVNCTSSPNPDGSVQTNCY